MSAKGGITKGKSHKEGGIPMVVKSTGQKVELEGGEGVINKKNMADTELHSFDGKEMTKCEVASEINSDKGNGVTIDCDNIVGQKYEYKKGGGISEANNNLDVLDVTNEQSELSDLDILLGDTLLDYSFQKLKKKVNKFKDGGSVLRNQNKEVVYVVLKNEHPYYVYDKKGNNITEIKLDSNIVYRFVYYGVKDNEVVFGLDELNNDTFVYIDKEEVNIVGLSQTIKGIKPYEFFTNENEWNLSDNDIKILELIRARKKYKVQEKNDVSNFRGDNLANYLSTELNKLIYSLLFKGKKTDFKIKNIYITNNGVGNLLALAPKYLENVYVKFIDSKYTQIEKIIDRIQNNSVEEDFDYNKEFIDAIIHVYKESNPKIDVSQNFIDSEYNKKQNLIFLGVAEFTSENNMNTFLNSIYNSNGDKEIKFYRVEEGLSLYGKITLIYNILKTS